MQSSFGEYHRGADKGTKVSTRIERIFVFNSEFYTCTCHETRLHLDAVR